MPWHPRLAALIACLLFSAAAVADEVRFPSRDGTPLSGLLFLPEGTGPFPGVVALHGCSGLLTASGRLKAREKDWADRLTAAGYAVLFPDSFNPRGVKSVCSLTERPVLPERERVRDAYDALQWLQGRREVRADRVALLGWSHGAMTALWTMAQKSPGRPAALARDFVGAVAFYPGCAKIGREMPDYAGVAPMLWQLGAADEWTPAAPCLKLAEAARQRPGPTVEVDLYAGAHHGFDQPKPGVHEVLVRNSVYKTGEKRVHVGQEPQAREKSIARVMAWLAEKLEGDGR